MILSKDLKYAFMCVPRTGTHTIRKLFGDQVFDTSETSDKTRHLPISAAAAALERIYKADLTKIKYIVLYRDPIERFISAYKYILDRPHELAPFLMSNPDDSISRFVYEATIFAPKKHIVFREMKNWTPDNSIIFPFDDFNNSVYQIAELMGVDISGNKIGIENPSSMSLSGELTDDEKKQLQLFYSIDYTLKP